MPLSIAIPRPHTPDSTRTPSPTTDGVLYFGYGSNLWRKQVEARYPSAKFIGLGRLRHWRFQINANHIPNIVEAAPAPYSPRTAKWLAPLCPSGDLRSDNDRVYGMVWQLDALAEAAMDDSEGRLQHKEYATAELWVRREGQTGPAQLSRGAKRRQVMFYVDRSNTEQEAQCSGALSYKLQQGIADAIEMGVPKGYVDECVKPYLPKTDGDIVQQAVRRAMKMGVDVKAMVASVEQELAQTGEDEADGEDHKAAFERLLSAAGMAQAEAFPVRQRSATSTW